MLSRTAVCAVLTALSGTHRVMVQLRYGSNLRLLAWVRLRVKDLDVEQCQLIVWQGKGGNDQATALPARLHEPLRAHLEHVRLIHEQDHREGFGAVWLPDAPARKWPSASRE